MNSSLYRSSSIYLQHHFLPRVCSANIMTTSPHFSHSPTPKTKQSSTESEDYYQQFPPLSASSNKSLRRSKVDRGSTPSQSSQSHYSSSRHIHAPVYDTSVTHQSISKEANGATGSKHMGNVSRTSRVDHPSTPTKHSQSPTTRKDGFSSKRDTGKNKRTKHLPFDICLPDHQLDQVSNKHRVLGPGMVLLKHYLPLDAQVDIVKTCRQLGVKPRGFYQPGYRVGSKLRLQMMCLGRNWDPQTKYGEIDSDPPPDIPGTFTVLVEQAIREAHALIDREDAETILPMMSPDICIVNFYSETGRLGLHQDRDESRESIDKGLPIVSFSIGDSAEFLYGVERDVEKAEQVKLESGDVLIFGGESRMIFHGVKSIIPHSAPMRLLSESKLRPGRLNLTFRHF